MFSATARSVYLRKRHVTQCIGGWVCPTVGHVGCWKSRLHRVSIPEPSSRQRVAIPTEPHQPTKNRVLTKLLGLKQKELIWDCRKATYRGTSWCVPLTIYKWDEYIKEYKMGWARGTHRKCGKCVKILGWEASRREGLMFAFLGNRAKLVTYCHLALIGSQLVTYCHLALSGGQLETCCHLAKSGSQLETYCQLVPSGSKLVTYCHFAQCGSQLVTYYHLAQSSREVVTYYHIAQSGCQLVTYCHLAQSGSQLVTYYHLAQSDIQMVTYLHLALRSHLHGGRSVTILCTQTCRWGQHWSYHPLYGHYGVWLTNAIFLSWNPSSF
jgi:hypothetical protein